MHAKIVQVVDTSITQRKYVNAQKHLPIGMA